MARKQPPDSQDHAFGRPFERMDFDKMLNIGIVGGGTRCKSLLEIIAANKHDMEGVEIIGVVDVNAEAAGYRLAEQLEITVMDDFQALYGMDGLNLIMELTGDDEVVTEIIRTKPVSVAFINHEAVELFYKLFRMKGWQTEKYQRSARLNNEITGYWNLYNNAIIGMMRTKLDGTIIMCNRRFLEMAGYERQEEIINNYKAIDFFVDPSRRGDLLDQLRENGVANDFELFMKRKGGSTFWAQWTVRKMSAGYHEGLVIDCTAGKQAENESRFLARRLINAQEEERGRIARDIHDELGQALAGMQFTMEALKQSTPLNLDHQKRKCDEVIAQIDEIGDTVRRIASELRPGMLDQLGLIPTMETYIKAFLSRHKEIRVNFQALGCNRRLGSESETVLYRVFQEAFTNITKHAKAQIVDVRLTFSYPDVILIIKDNGVGFDQNGVLPAPGEKERGIGLLGMRERVHAAGGTIEIKSRRKKGTMVKVVLSIVHGNN